MLKTRAFPLEPNKPAKILVTYKNVCTKDRDLVNVWYPLNTEKYSAKAIEEVSVTVDIKSKADVTAVYSPTHDLNVQRLDSRHVIATYTAKNTLPTQDFQMYYKEANESVGATLLSHQPDISKDGYFLMLVSPNPSQGKQIVAAKDVVIMLDRSGSMSEDDKIEQAKTAMKFVVKNLNKEDRFNVISFSDDVEAFSDKMMDANEKNVKEAVERLDHIDAHGGTNIYEALQLALKQVEPPKEQKAASAAQRPAYIIFLTDGRPTVGKTDEPVILDDAAKVNTGKARIFAFGVGYDVNVRLLDKLVGANNGRSDYVKPKEAIESKISAFYAKIKNPVMTNLKVELANVRMREMYPQQIPDLFEGDQVMLVGRFYGDDAQKLHSPEPGVFQTQLIVKGIYEGKERAFEYPVTLRAGGKQWRYDFVEKIWAIRRVGFLLDQIQLHGSNKELLDELVSLGKNYGIMTPYTSFLADERNSGPATSPGAISKLGAAAQDASKDLSVVEGGRGQLGAMNRQAMNEATRPGEKTKGNSRSSGWGTAGGSGRDKKEGEVGQFADMAGNTDNRHYEQQKQQKVANVQNVGNQTLYLRGSNLWYTPQTAKLDVQKDQDKIKVINRFSKEYFALVRANTTAENQVMSAQGEKDELLIELRGQAYQIK
jgi:Ca-activated chloride channel family protein